MSMPSISKSPNPVTRDQACTDIIESIALEETALAHLINAEGEKIQTAIKQTCRIEDLVKIDQSVEDIINKIIYKQIILSMKLQQVCSCSKCNPPHSKPDHHIPKPCKQNHHCCHNDDNQHDHCHNGRDC